MSKSIRIRTNPGESRNIQIKVEQDFDVLEVLSLKISQQDLYTNFCANYGVVVGRVIANEGYGVPNSKVSVFIPISDEDEKNELIKDLYPYRTTQDTNKNNLRYNLLLSETTCSLNVPVGSFPTKEEVLNNDIMIEIFDKYYKYTTKTNDAGDYMIFGVPTGQQTIHMDVDLSDAGSFSPRPYDFIDNGFSDKLFKSRTEFKTSDNLNTLPQIKSGDIGCDVIPFWGDEDQCIVGITRVDFNTNFKFEPVAIYTGAIFTDQDKNSLSKRCNPTNDMGNQCELRTGAGSVEVIRVNNYEWDTNTDKIIPLDLSEYTLPQGSDVIDENGTFAVTVPMNVGHVITDEYGNLVKSFDPTKGVATKGLYRFKMKFDEPPGDWKRKTASVITPSLNRVTGGVALDMADTTKPSTEAARWTTDLDVWKTNNTLSDVFYMDYHDFHWNQIYTLSQYIPKYKKGNNRWSFLGLKGVDECGEKNTIPFNGAMWKPDIVYGLLSFFIRIQASFLKFKIFMNNLTFCISIKSKLIDSIATAFGGDKGLMKCYTCLGTKKYVNFVRGGRIEKDIKNLIVGSSITLDGKGAGSIVNLRKIRFKAKQELNTNFLFDYSFGDNPPTVQYEGSLSNKNIKYDSPYGTPNNDDCDDRLGLGNYSEYYVWAKIDFEDNDDNETNKIWINLGEAVNLKVGHFFKECDCDGITDKGSYDTLQKAKDACEDYCRTINIRPFKFIANDDKTKELPCESNDYVLNNTCEDYGCDCSGISGNFGIDFSVKAPRCCSSIDDSGVLVTDDGCDDNCTSMCMINDWLCCAIYDLAIERQTIRYTFYDAWLNGSAYLPQFKYKSKVKKEGKPDEVTKDKFCGPGGDQRQNDNYKNQSCKGDRGIAEGNSCIVRSPNTVDSTSGDWQDNGGGYHGNDYETGASDSGEFIYCPETLPTKIINIGRTDVCEDTVDRINRLLSLNGTVLRLFNSMGCPGNNNNCYTGTYYETGYDTEQWVNVIGNTSYDNPELAVINMMARGDLNCRPKSLFKGAGGCGEYELENVIWIELHEISKIHADIILGEVDGFDTYDGIEFKNGLNEKFHPSVIGRDLDTKLGDRINRHHFRNSPYFYFGINPGKTAMDKLRKEYLIKK